MSPQDTQEPILVKLVNRRYATPSVGPRQRPEGPDVVPARAPHRRIAADPARRHRVRAPQERFLLEHVADATDPWLDRSWAAAHADGSGHVYPNFSDPALVDWTLGYHAGNYARLAAVKNAYDPHRFLDFPKPSDPQRRTAMSKVISAHAVSVDGYITGRDPSAGRGLGDAIR